ncbi:calcium/proton exchanger [Batrachochytrium salamandrivorans]|nr:calcium/proton exchanger [Batrachochytrium salamandrivorans]
MSTKNPHSCRLSRQSHSPILFQYASSNCANCYSVSVLHWGDTVTFTLNFIAIVLAKMLDLGTDELSKKFGQSIGALINASFGNAVVDYRRDGASPRSFDCCAEFASRIYSFESSLCVGLVFPYQWSLSQDPVLVRAANTAATLLAVTIFGFLIPAAFSYEPPRNPDLPEEEEEEEKLLLTTSVAIGVLIVSAVVIGFCAEYLVDSIEGLSKTVGISETFIGLIILPIVGNAAEHVTALFAAARGKMDLAMELHFGSSMQIALFVTCAGYFWMDYGYAAYVEFPHV